MFILRGLPTCMSFVPSWRKEPPSSADRQRCSPPLRTCRGGIRTPGEPSEQGAGRQCSHTRWPLGVCKPPEPPLSSSSFTLPHPPPAMEMFWKEHYWQRLKQHVRAADACHLPQACLVLSAPISCALSPLDAAPLSPYFLHNTLFLPLNFFYSLNFHPPRPAPSAMPWAPS